MAAARCQSSRVARHDRRPLSGLLLGRGLRRGLRRGLILRLGLLRGIAFGRFLRDLRIAHQDWPNETPHAMVGNPFAILVLIEFRQQDAVAAAAGALAAIAVADSGIVVFVARLVFRLDAPALRRLQVVAFIRLLRIITAARALRPFADDTNLEG